VAKVGEGRSEVPGRVLFALAVFVGVSVSEVTLEVGVGHGVAADGTAATGVFEFFACLRKFKNCCVFNPRAVL
jgi:hypothetical protein